MAHKNAPIAPKGTTFSWSDNGHVDTTALKKATTPADANREKAKLRLTLVSTTGHTYTYDYKGVVDFNNTKSVSMANNWRRQLLNRKLITPGDGVGRDPRPIWTAWEQEFVSCNVVSVLEDTKEPLTDLDWEVIAEYFNKEAAGTVLPAGVAYASSYYKRDGQMVTSAAGTTRDDIVVPRRSAVGMKGMVPKWPKLDQLIRETLAETEEEE